MKDWIKNLDTIDKIALSALAILILALFTLFALCGHHKNVCKPICAPNQPTAYEFDNSCYCDLTKTLK